MIYDVTQVCHRQSCIVHHGPSHQLHQRHRLSYLVGGLQGKQGGKYDLKYDKGVSYIIVQVTRSITGIPFHTSWGQFKANKEASMI